MNVFYLLIGLLLMSHQVCAELVDAPDTHAQLEEINARIETLQETLGATRGLKQEAEQELERLERNVGSLTRDLLALDRRIADLNDALAQLRGVLAQQQQNLRAQQDVLRRQLHSAYVMGREERLKLLLRQEDPGVLSRVVAYYEYLSRARARRIDDIRQRVAALHSTERQIGEQREQLSVLREQRRSDREQLQVVRLRREVLLEELEQTLRGQGLQLDALRHDAVELQRLIDGLEQAEARAELKKNQPVATRKGQLIWPVKGRLSARFGAPRAARGLSWDGVVISAPEGAEVSAVYHGRVAFADWLRGFGLLMILDHGDGYMSLYGFNQTLLKETGEWVDEGETIALVGDSGGRNHASLYFGIRHAGRPENPRQWCLRLRGSRTG